MVGLRYRAADGLLPLVEQRVEIVDERLHFCRVLAFDAPITALVQSGKTGPKVVDGRKAAAHLHETGDHGEHPEHHHQWLPEYVVDHDGEGHAGMVLYSGDQCC